MISLYERETKPLSEEDISYAKILAEGFKQLPKGRKIKNYEIVEAFQKKRNIILTEVKVRKLIQYIRSKDLVLGLCSSSDGYWVTDDPKELIAVMKSLRERILHQQYTLNSLVRQYHLLFDRPEQPNLVD